MSECQEADESRLLDHIIGTIYGNCAGDAIGLLTEFLIKEEAQKYYGEYENIEYEHKIGDMHRCRWKNGDWTDDSDQMILIMQSLTELGKIDPVTIGLKIKKWMRKGFSELGDFGGLGIGATTAAVLGHSKYDEDPHQAASAIWEQTGRFVAPNGGVMRTSILGVHDYKNIDQVIQNTLDACKVTHADPRCQASCVAVTTAIAMMLQRDNKYLLQDGELNIEAIIAKSYQYAKPFVTLPEQVEELHFHMFAKDLAALKLDEAKKIGYTYKCLGSGFWALRQSDFRKALQSLLMEGGDADTNGAVAGALLGCKLGRKNLPPTWIDGFVHKKWLDEQISKYLSKTFGLSFPTTADDSHDE